MRLDRWRTVGFIVGVLALMSAFFFYGQAVKQNRKAIRVGCQLLSDKIVEASSQQQQGATRLFVTGIKRVLNPGERFLLDFYLRQGQGGLTVPPCDRIADHPESVLLTP